MSQTEPSNESHAVPEDALDRLQHEDAARIYEWLCEYGGTGEMKIELFRRTPESYQGVKTNGLLETLDEPISAEEIKERHGGGKYQIRVNVKARNKNGAPIWRYAGARTFDLAGLPRVDALLNADDSGSAPFRRRNGEGGDGIAGQAMNMARLIAQDAREEARTLRDGAARTQGTDPAVVSLIDRLADQVVSLQEALSKKDERILEVIARPTDTRQEDKLLDIMRDSAKDHATRITEVRVAHDSELRQLREYHNQELRNRESRFEKEIDQVRAGHQREIDSLKDAHRTAMESQKQAYEMRIDSLKDTVDRAQRELSEARTEVAGLRARKEQGPLEQLQGLVAIKNGMESLFPTPEDEEKTSTAERIIGAIMESPVAQGIASRIADAGKLAAPGSDQMVQVRDRHGKVHTLPASYVQQMQARAQAEAGQPAQSGPPRLNPAEVKQAVAFLESAYRNGHPPQTVAATARNLVPGAILNFLKKKGVDAFLNEAADLDDSSPLATVAGRQWIRSIGQFLLEGTVPPPEEAPSAAPEPSEAPDEADDDEDDAVDAGLAGEVE
jgi:hypothetical protein